MRRKALKSMLYLAGVFIMFCMYWVFWWIVTVLFCLSPGSPDFPKRFKGVNFRVLNLPRDYFLNEPTPQYGQFPRPQHLHHIQKN
jgi:hypothetical protein